MEAECFSETLVSTYKARWRYNPEKNIVTRILDLARCTLRLLLNNCMIPASETNNRHISEGVIREKVCQSVVSIT
jgi:hypothetical protein